MFVNKQAEAEIKISIPNFLQQKLKENIDINSQSLTSKTNDKNKLEIYSFIWHTSQAIVRTPQMSWDDWHHLLKKWRDNQEKLRKEERAKKRICLEAELAKLQKEKKLKEEKPKQREENFKKFQKSNQHQSNVSLWNNTSNQKQKNNFWVSNSSTTSNNKIHVQGYYRKDGTYVKAYTRDK